MRFEARIHELSNRVHKVILDSHTFQDQVFLKNLLDAFSDEDVTIIFIQNGKEKSRFTLDEENEFYDQQDETDD